MAIHEEYQRKNYFCTHAGLHQWSCMPFGLVNTPATFQRDIDVILSWFRWRTYLVYLDDVVIFSKNIEEHIQQFDQIQQKLG